jgi:MFS family permease
MNADAQTGSPQIAGDRGPAESLGKLYRAGWLLVALSTVAIGVGCFVQPWLATTLTPHFQPFSFYTLISVALMLAGAALAAVPAALAAVPGVRAWAALACAAVLVAATVGGVLPYREVANTRDVLIRIALIGALLMLASLERRRQGKISRWFRVGRWVFTAAALFSIVTQAVESYWRQSGFDMFYRNYDVQTLFNSLWSWRYPLELVFSVLALVAAAAICFRPLARVGALLLAGVCFVGLPLLFLYRVDDFFGDPVALVEILYSWALDLGLAGGALLVAAGLLEAVPAVAAEARPAAAVLRRFFSRVWVRVALSVAAFVFVAAIVLHGLIPTFFYEANTRGDPKLGALATRIYAATYIHESGDYSWKASLAENIGHAGPAGLACAANNAQGCADMADFYRGIGWNWGRAWRLSAKAAALIGSPCNGGDMTACFDLGKQYDQGYGVATDAAHAAALYEKACDGRVADACQKLADDYWYGIGIAADKHKGATLMKKGCALGSQWACQRLDFMRHDDPDWKPEFDK